jgi:transcriptional regulator NrdR family protein
MEIQVKKRDGTLENFDETKIARVAHAAGLTQDEAAVVARHISAWASSRHKQALTSLQIRDKVLEELKGVDMYAANLFEWYQQTKEK